jgi:segregation and condensation protein B
MNLDAQIEAVLFWKAEPVSVKKLAEIFAKNEKEIREAVVILKNNLQNRGLTLLDLDDSVSLGTAREMSPLIEKLTKEELVRDLGKAGLETISIVLYQGPITRAELLAHLGVSAITDLPDYENVKKNIAAFKAAAAEEAGQAEKESDGETSEQSEESQN